MATKEPLSENIDDLMDDLAEEDYEEINALENTIIDESDHEPFTIEKTEKGIIIKRVNRAVYLKDQAAKVDALETIREKFHSGMDSETWYGYTRNMNNEKA